MTFHPFAKVLIFFGIILILIGIFWQFGSRFIPLGHLPGDISVKRENVQFYFPWVTCLVLSSALSLVLYLIRRFWK